MSNLPGNPHYSEDWGRGIDVGYHGDQAQSEVLAAQVDATLALAYEQRTANLIALADLTMHGGLNPDYDMETIYNRLGLGDTQ